MMQQKMAPGQKGEERGKRLPSPHLFYPTNFPTRRCEIRQGRQDAFFPRSDSSADFVEFRTFLLVPWMGGEEEKAERQKGGEEGRLLGKERDGRKEEKGGGVGVGQKREEGEEKQQWRNISSAAEKEEEDGGWRRRRGTNLLASVSTAKRTPPRFLASFDRGGGEKKNIFIYVKAMCILNPSPLFIITSPPFSQTLTTLRSLTRTRATSPGPWAGCTPPQTSSLAEEEEKEIERGGGGVEFCTNQKGENTHV